MTKRSIILFSAVVGLVALVGGLLGIAQRSAEYKATAKVLIVPTSADDGLSISGADTLSRGPIASTFSEAFSSSDVVGPAFSANGITGADAKDVSVASSVITDTSALQIAASSGSPVLAERAANAVASATPNLGGYTVAFKPRQISNAKGTAARTGASTTTLVLIAIIVAGLLAIAAAAVLGRVFANVDSPRGGTDGPDGAEIVIPATRTREQPKATRRS